MFLSSINLTRKLQLKHEISKQNFFELSFIEKSLKHEISKQKIFEFSYMEKMLIINFIDGKNAYHTISYMKKKCLFAYFHTYTFIL